MNSRAWYQFNKENKYHIELFEQGLHIDSHSVIDVHNMNEQNMKLFSW